jgi:hypothetical protein
MSVHHLELFAEDGEIRPRLTCTATPDAPCRRRPLDPDQESWTDEDETTPGHECWAVEWAQDVVWDTVFVETDGVLSTVDVEVSYEEGVVVGLTPPEPTLPDPTDPTYAEVRAAAEAMDGYDSAVEGVTQSWDVLTEMSQQHYLGSARAALVAARIARGEDQTNE